jgi:hypothetical protein
VGIASGAGPFQRVPGALDEFDDHDRAALLLLPGDPTAAAAAFAAGFEPLAELTRKPGNSELLAAFENLLSSQDREVLRTSGWPRRSPTLYARACRQGTPTGPTSVTDRGRSNGSCRTSSGAAVSHIKRSRAGSDDLSCAR